MADTTSNMTDTTPTPLPDEGSKRMAWVVVGKTGVVSVVPSLSGYEKDQIIEICGSDYVPAPVTQLKEHNVGMAMPNIAYTEDNVNTAMSALCGTRIAGKVVLGQRRGTGMAMHMKIRSSWKYIHPFLRHEAEEVADILKRKFLNMNED